MTRLVRIFRVCASSALYLALLAGTVHAAAAPTLYMIGGASSVSIFDQTTLAEQAYVAAPGRTKSVAVSPDGTKAFVATAGGIQVVNAQTHLPIRRLSSNNTALVRLSPDGSRLYAANTNGSVWVYNTATGFVTQRVPFLVKDFFLYAVDDMTVSADGNLIAMASSELLCGEFGCPPGDPSTLITEIDGQTGNLIRRVKNSNFSLSSIAISGDNSAIYTANGSAIQKVNATLGNTLATIPFPANRIALDGTAGLLFAGTVNSPFKLGVFSATDNSSVTTVMLPGPVKAMVVAPDHATVFAGGCVSNAATNDFPCPVAAVSTGTWQVLATGTLAGDPGDFAVSAGISGLWVANATPVELTAVNTKTNRVFGEAEANYSPLTMTATPSGNKVYTANEDGTVSVIDGSSLARLKVLSATQLFNLVGEDCVSPDGNRAYISVNGLLVIDTATDTIARTLAESPFGCVVSPDSNTLYTFNAQFDEVSNRYRLFVTSYSTSTFAMLNTQNFLADQLPTNLFVSPDGNTLYMINAFLAYVIPTSTLVTDHTLALNVCIDAALSPDGATLYCLDQPFPPGTPDSVQAISTASGSVLQTYTTNAWAFGKIALTPDGNSLYLSLQIPSNPIPGSLQRLNLATGTFAFANTTLSGEIVIR